MIGSLLLQKCLDHEDISQVTSIARNPSGVQHNKLNEVIHNDFSSYSSLEEVFINCDIAHFCVGVYTGAVSKEDFRKITVEYTAAFIDELSRSSPSATFCFLSGQGADQSEQSGVMFARDKGAAENYILANHPGASYLFRPAYIYPVQKRKAPNLLYAFMRVIYPVLKVTFPKSVIRSDTLAEAMFVAGLQGAPQTILENQDIKELLRNSVPS